MTLVYVAFGALLLCLLRYGLAGFIDPVPGARQGLALILLNWSSAVLGLTALASGLAAIGVAALSALRRRGD